MIHRQWKEHSFSDFTIFLFSGVDEEWRNTYSEREACTIKKSRTGSGSVSDTYTILLLLLDHKIFSLLSSLKLACFLLITLNNPS